MLNKYEFVFRCLLDLFFLPKQAIFPSSPIYFKSYLAASFSIGSFSDLSSMANISFCLNSALSSKFILASKQTTKEKNKIRHRHLEITVSQSFWNIVTTTAGRGRKVLRDWCCFQRTISCGSSTESSRVGEVFLKSCVERKYSRHLHTTQSQDIFCVCFKQSSHELWQQCWWIGQTVWRIFIRESTLAIVKVWRSLRYRLTTQSHVW